jgi:hypothetical protein
MRRRTGGDIGEAVIKLFAMIAINGVISGFAGWGFASLLDYFGAFGSGSQSGFERGLGVLFIGFPLSWLSIFILLMAMHELRTDSPPGGWFIVGASTLGFIILFMGFYAILLSAS